MDNIFSIMPYKSVGNILFGMSKKDVIELFGRNPDRESVGFTKRISLNWDNVSIKISQDGQVDEITFVDGTFKPIFNGHNLLGTESAAMLNQIESPLSKLGYEIYCEHGFALTDDGAVCIFSDKLLDDYRKL